MKTIIPQDYAVGMGAAAGAYLLSSENDPMEIAAGAVIGGATGFAGNFTVPNYENLTANSQGLKLPSQTASSMTVQNVREQILSRANTVLNSNVSSFTGSFNPSQPFSTLSSNNLSQLSDYIYQTSDLVDLRRISNLISQRSDSVGINLSSINLGISQTARSTKIHESASETVREQAFKAHLKNTLGYTSDTEIHDKYLKFRTLLNKEGTHYLNDGELNINGMETIKLYGRVGKEDNSVFAHIKNNNVYLANDVNPTGLAKIMGVKADVVADALGLKVTDAFNMQALMESTDGMTPDDLIALASNSDKVSDKALRDLIKTVNETEPKYDPNLTGQFAKTQDRSALVPNAFHRNLQGRTNFGQTFNFNMSSSGLSLDLDKPFRPLTSTAFDGQVSEVTQLGRLIARTSDYNTKEGVKPDFSTQFVNNRFNRSVINLENPAARNSSAALRESIATQVKPTRFQEEVTGLVKELGLDMQYGDTIAIPRLSVNMEKYNPVAAAILGSDISLADGFSISNKNITSNFEMKESRQIRLASDASGNFGLIGNNTINSILDGSLNMRDVNQEIELFSGLTTKDIQQAVRNPFSNANDTPSTRIIKDIVLSEMDKGVPFNTGIENYFIERSNTAREYLSDLTVKPRETIAFNTEGLPIKMNADLDSYLISDLRLEKNQNGHTLSVITDGVSNLGNQSIAKLFGLDTKTQIRNLDSSLFSQAGLVAELVNKGNISIENGLISANNGMTYKPSEIKKVLSTSNIDFSHPIFNGESDYFEKLNTSLNNSVGIITDSSDSGRKVFSQIKDAVSSGSNTTGMDSRLYDLLQSGYKTNKTDLNALSNLGIALTSSKNSSSIVLESLVRYKSSLQSEINSFKQSIFSGSAIDVRDFASTLDSLGFDTSLLRSNSVSGLDSILPQYNTFSTNLVKHFNDPHLKLNTMTNNPNQYLNFLPVFNTYGSENISVAFTTPSRNLEGVLGSASTDKALSQNAQLQLLYSGITREDLSLFGQQDMHKVTDLHSLLSMKNIADSSINDEVSNTTLTAFRRAMSSDSTGRREALKGLGIDIKSAYGSYNLSNPIMGYKSIPIPLDNSSIFGSYFSETSESYANPRSVNLIADIIDKDMQIQRATSTAEKEVLTNQMTESLKEFDDLVKESLYSKSNALPKAASRLHSETSLLSNVSATSGILDDFITARGVEGKHQSFAEVSIGGAIKRLRSAGYNVKDEKDLFANYTEVVTSGGVKVRRMKHANSDSPFFSLMNREPSTGPGSIRMLEYVVNNNIDKKDLSLRISYKDNLYKYLQFGDHDADHVSEFFISSANASKAAEMHAKLTPLTESLSTLEKYGQNLGVKGGDKSLGSLMDHLSDLDYDKAVSSFYSDVQVTNEQAGLRKRVAPAATRLAAALNNSLESASLNMSDKAHSRLLSHFAVENLIKSAHADASKYKAGMTEVEQLEALRKNFINNKDSQGKYLKTLEDFLGNMLHEDATPEMKKLHNQSVQNVVQSEKLHATSDPINTMDLNRSRNKTAIEALKDVENVLAGNTAAMTTHNTEDIVTSLDTKAKRGYNEISKTIKQNIIDNKKPLVAGGLALLATGLLTQDKPSFTNNARAEANPSAMMMRPLQEGHEQSQGAIRRAINGLDLGQASDYVLPVNTSYTVDGHYSGDRPFKQAMRTSIFGENGLDSARIETY